MKEYLKLLQFVKPYRGLLALAFLFMIGTAIFDGASLSMLVPLSDRVLTNKEIIIPRDDLPQFLVSIVNVLNTADPRLILKWMAFILICVFSLKGFCTFVQNFIMNVTVTE